MTVFFSFRFADSNQARQRKRKKMTELKKKLREKVLQYNTVVEGDPIDEELACSLTEGYILPWERHGDGMIYMNCYIPYFHIYHCPFCYLSCNNTGMG